MYFILWMAGSFLLHWTPIHSSSSNEKYWWKKTIIYQIVIPAFKDSDGDGIGDINGITSKLDHFVDLNVETLWLSPCYPSPMKDIGYDITNFTDINPLFGTLADFDNLVSELKKRNMKLMLDLVINHSSNEHPWFQKSIARIEPYTDFYVWKDPAGYDKFGKPLPPNNWDILSFWLDRGVNGFRMDAVLVYMEDEFYQDEEYFGQYILNQPATYNFLNKLRTYLDETYNDNNNFPERVFVAETVQKLSINLDYYGNNTFKLVHYPFSFDMQLHMYNNGFFNASYLDEIITSWLKVVPKDNVVNWVTESHDLPRVGTLLGERFSDIFITLTMLLPGAVSIYYGQEIGMMDSKIRPDLSKDRIFRSRDPQRTPMQWDSSHQAGFSTNTTTWLPVNPIYWKQNVESQKNEVISVYNMFKKLSNLRNTETIVKGEFQSFIPSTWVYVFVRKLLNHESYIVVFNLNSYMETVKLKFIIPEISESVEVVTSSINSGYKWGRKIRTKSKLFNKLEMRPVSSVVLKTL